MKDRRNKYNEDANNSKYDTLPDIANLKLINNNFDSFKDKLLELTERQISAAGVGISLSCLLVDTDGRYDAHYDLRSDKSKVCMQFTGRIYQANTRSLYLHPVGYSRI